MAVRIGSNTIANTIQRRLSQANEAYSQTSQRLASGQRVNKAVDDAAGLAVSMSLKASAVIYRQGLRNLNDGLSAIAIAESAMNELSSIAQRIEEISSQAINGTYGAAQRTGLQSEVTALQNEWNRIVEGTSFNQNSMLTGSGTRTVLQGGIGAAGILELQVGEAQLANGIEGFAGGTTRVNTDSSGNQSSGGSSTAAAISTNGRYIAFSSDATNLVSGDSNGQQDAFVKDLLTGQTIRVSTTTSGTEASGGASSAVGISGDGRYVAFHSSATNLVSGDANGQQDLFIKDLVTGATTRVNTDSTGQETVGQSTTFGAISADGRYVFFYTAASNLVSGDTNGSIDGFMKDTLTGETTRVTTATGGGQATGGSSIIRGVSTEGRYVVFYSSATNLATSDSNGAIDVFVKDIATGTTTRISTDSQGNQASGGDSIANAISADGRYVAFHSDATNLVSGDTNAVRDVFVKDTLTGGIQRVNTDSNGNQATSGSAFVIGMSADARYVVFDSTATNLVSGDTNGASDGFMKDTITGTMIRLSTSSAGVEANGTGGFVRAISANGRYAVFHSDATNLISSDSNALQDVFLRDLTKTGINQMSGMVVSNQASASLTLDLAKLYQDELSEYRGVLGAASARLTSYMATLRTTSENYIIAESRIMDADVATETAQLVRNSILQDVGTALLSQANQQPRILIQLLNQE